jgi:hypothetical protein
VNERTGCWGEVEPGTYVRDRNNVAWRIAEKRGAQLLLVRPHEQPRVIRRPASDVEVTILEPTHDEIVALVGRELGGTVIAEQKKGDGWRVPPLSRQLDDIHSHMFLMHGYYTRTGPGSRNAQKLLEFHREDHTDGPTSDGYQRHRHLIDWETKKK